MVKVYTATDFFQVRAYTLEGATDKAKMVFFSDDVHIEVEEVEDES